MRERFNPLVSVVIVDYKKDNPLLVECLEGIIKQTYKRYEVILLTDYPVNLDYPKLKKVAYGRYVGPAIKRDQGAEMARGEIIAFIDDDAFPKNDWLQTLVKDFKDWRVAAVGGPGVTPPGSDWKEQLSGWFSASPIGGGPFTYRFLPRKRMEVDDYPSMNLSVRRRDFLAVGGFDSNYWPGEDTKLCLDLVHRLGRVIVYDPGAVVYHHRRPLWLPHFRQYGNFGIHRGYFARILPRTSFRLEYFGPSLILLGCLYLILFQVLGTRLGFFSINVLKSSYSIGIDLLLVYLGLLIFNGIWILANSKNVLFGIASIPLTLATHLWYGLRFIEGFLSLRKVENSNQPLIDV